MGLKMVPDVGRVSEGPNSGRGKGQGRLRETSARWKNMQRTLELKESLEISQPPPHCNTERPGGREAGCPS